MTLSAAFCYLARTPIAVVPATLDCKPQVLYLAGGTLILPSHPAEPITSVCAGQARPIFPFTAVIGQEEMKLALILNVIDPKIGGVMIMGDRGTGKTTTIRALADLLPQVPVVAKDPFNSGGHALAFV
jgi:Cdc6-like AAA superfamily ATPase